jgi:hypothetical protein
MFSTLDPCMVPDHTSYVVHVDNLSLVPTRSKQAPTPERLARPSSWVNSFPLPHDSLGVGDRSFDQVVTQLHQLTGPIYQHAIGTFNTCSWGPTHWSLTDISGGYNLGGANFTHQTPRPSQPTVSAFHLRALPGLRLSKLNISNWTKGRSNPKSHEWDPPLDFYCKLSSKHSMC